MDPFMPGNMVVCSLSITWRRELLPVAASSPRVLVVLWRKVEEGYVGREWGEMRGSEDVFSGGWR